VVGTHAERIKGLTRAEARAADTGDSTANESCPVDPDFDANRPSYDALIEAARTDDRAFTSYIAAQGTAGTTCSVLEATSRSIAARWGWRATTLTVALVILGLGGFLLALAADPDRTLGPAHWLLSLGVIGVVVGAAVALSVPMVETMDGNIDLE